MDDDIEERHNQIDKRFVQLMQMDLFENKPQDFREKLFPQRLDISRQERLAFNLLAGVYQMLENGKVTFHYLSSKTKPTEREARLALSRLLLSGKPPAWVLEALAAHFVPEVWLLPIQRTVVFKQVSKGHARPILDILIATRVRGLRGMGKSYEEAIRSVAEVFDRDERHIKKVYARYKDLAHEARIVSSDKRSNDMASDS